jgi:hypothetical protein
MKGAGYTLEDAAVALRLSDHEKDAVTKALGAAGFPKAKIPGALSYAGFN